MGLCYFCGSTCFLTSSLLQSAINYAWLDAQWWDKKPSHYSCSTIGITTKMHGCNISKNSLSVLLQDFLLYTSYPDTTSPAGPLTCTSYSCSKTPTV